MTVHAIVLRVSDSDFDMLPAGSMAWAGVDWRAHQGRFLPFPPNDDPISWHFAHAYWFERWADVLMARGFLEAANRDYQILADEGLEGVEPAFVILTNYTSPARAEEPGT